MEVSKHDLPLGHLSICQVCGSEDLQSVIDLGHHPPCDSLLFPSQLKEAERIYPLNLVRCRDCGLVQIDYVVDPSVVFHPDYPYQSGITPTLVSYLQSIADDLVTRYHLKRNSFVVDIGSNDGTLLQGFKNLGMRVLGVEPTNIADIANERGIPTLKTFFDEGVSETIGDRHGKASVVTATNMFAHVQLLGTMIRGVQDILEEGGIFLTESHYLPSILETVQYDSIYHEHLKYYSLKPLIKLFEYYDFVVTDAERIPNYGGSIRVLARKGKGYEMSQRLRDLIEKEEEVGIYKEDTYEKFRGKIVQSKLDLQTLLLELKRKGHRVPGIGCPGRSSTLLNYCNIDPELMPYIAEQSTCLKVGMYLPGKHIPIVDEEMLFREDPPYCVMLSWHYAEPIIRNLRRKGLTSKIILPLPDVHIVEN